MPERSAAMQRLIFPFTLCIFCSMIVSSASGGQEVWTKWKALGYKGITSCELGDAVNSIFIACNKAARRKHSHASVVDRENREFLQKKWLECCDDKCYGECKTCMYYIEYRCKIYMP